MKSCSRRGGSVFLFSTPTIHLPPASTAIKDKACNNYKAETQCGVGCGAGRAELQLSHWQINSTHNYSSGDYGMQINEFDNPELCTELRPAVVIILASLSLPLCLQHNSERKNRAERCSLVGVHKDKKGSNQEVLLPLGLSKL